MRPFAYIVMTLLTAFPALLEAAPVPPQAEIANASLQVKLYLPDAEHGFYRGTRFDWSGVVADLQYTGHSYYGPWFTATDPKIPDFIYKGSDIVAGPCSAITGPVEEFTPASGSTRPSPVEPSSKSALACCENRMTQLIAPIGCMRLSTEVSGA